MLLVHSYQNNRGGNTYIHRGINQARDLVSSLDAHVTQGGLCYRVLQIKTKGEDCVKSPDPMYLTRQELVWGAMFKEQDSQVCLEAMSSGAEMAVDGQVLFLFSFVADLWWPKQFSRDLDVCPACILNIQNR